ncbi:coenzyme F420-0:L-glutamate ligase [Pseudomaricurvus alkylphenolicus]|uniref:coenzyme F420-0:L-glutamate ligase n=1 Tax=Pseudomaricurvus alkylphenolicus TaxID=1306991 RepID=UPI00142267BA|nr:coenzyme F420-0:L-glutamate ligase [Pseudomaricurvus alkylphenolicus]NIB38687.1 coenzyme F420-0:L-glutamate ligase [Pseudomaricurvus alkylphenolicus]
MSKKLEITALPDFPMVEPGDDLPVMIQASLDAAGLTLETGDCLVIAQKVISKSEDRYAYFKDIVPSEEAKALAEKAHKDPRLAQLILDESKEVIKHRPGAVIVEHRLGYVHANAGIDQSNIANDPNNHRVLLLPIDPDASAEALRQALQTATNTDHLNIVISDSAGRAWRNGIIGFAIGTAGFTPVVDEVGKKDLFGRSLEVTQIAVADELAAAASLLMGQADNGAPVVLIKGATLQADQTGSKSLIRAKEQDLFR